MQTRVTTSKLKNYLLAAVGFVILVGSFLVCVPKVSHAQDPREPQPVRVENTPDRPVPVNILNQVRTCPDENCPAATLNANDRNAFQRRVQFAIPSGDAFGSTTISVPAGKRLVIEFITVEQTFLLLGQRSRGISLHTVVDGHQGTYHLPVIKQVSVEGSFISIWTAAQQMRVYADAPQFRIEAGQTPQVTNSDADVSVSGYLVDM